MKYADRPSIVFFDLDLTLLKINSATLWIKEEYNVGSLGFFQCAYAAWALLTYQMGKSTIEPQIREAIKSLEGYEEDQFCAKVHRFYQQHIRQQFRDRGREVVRSYQSQGVQCFLLTSASSYLAECVTQELRLDGHLSQQFEVSEGRLTGRPFNGICHGVGKVDRAKAILDLNGTHFQDCYFYTDSYSDLPLLKEVGGPVVVNPDFRLKRYAKKSGWQRENW